MSKLFLDSGAYSSYENNTTINLQDYINFIKEHESEIEVYANLDDIGCPEKTWQNQKEMERQGLNPIPVYHLNEDQKYLEMCMKYPYFAVGGLASAKGASLTPFLDAVFRKLCTKESDYYPICKVHGFGIATPEIINRYPFYSIDSTSWVAYGKFGIILIPKLKHDTFRYDLPPYSIAISSRSKAVGNSEHFRNFSKMEQEWIKSYCKNKGFPIGRTLFKQVGPGYILKENEHWTDRKTKQRVEVIVDSGLCNNGEMRDGLNLLYFLDLEKNQPHWPWPWKVLSGGSLLD